MKNDSNIVNDNDNNNNINNNSNIIISDVLMLSYLCVNFIFNFIFFQMIGRTVCRK